MSTLEIKRGDSLDLLCVVQQDGLPVDITGWRIDCWLSSPDKVVHRFEAVIVDAVAGKYALRASPSMTEKWPLGGMSTDIRYTDSAGGVMTTRTIAVQVIERITSP